MRKLEDTSWLAQTINDSMDEEWEQNKYATIKWRCLNTLHIIVNEADKGHPNIIHVPNGIQITDIPDLSREYGTNNSRYGLQCKLRGLAENYKFDDGSYIISVMTTHDLNSARIKDMEELLFQISQS